MKRVAVVVLAVLVAGVAGCSFKMGNAQLEMLEGLSHPSNTVEKTEKVTPTEKK